jgi:hypothetical protein
LRIFTNQIPDDKYNRNIIDKLIDNSHKTGEYNPNFYQKLDQNDFNKMIGIIKDHHDTENKDLFGHIYNFASNSKFAGNEDSVKAMESLADYDDRLESVKRRILENKHTSEDTVRRYMKDDNRSIASIAGKKIASFDPDAYNQSLEGSHTVEISPMTEKLKHLKGKIEEDGGYSHKSKFAEWGHAGAPGQILDHKGHATGASIDAFLDKQPKQKYNISYDTWHGAQMHDDSNPQKVLQVNLTNDHVKKLKDAGVYELFKELHHDSFRSGHPVRPHTLGWARIDDSQPGHYHIDEIQSDYGTGTIRKLERYRDEGKLNEEDFNKYKNGIESINNILKGDFKNINHAIAGAAHQVAREKGITSTSYDMPNDQSKQSGLSSKKSLPGHFINTYIQTPKAMNYEQDYPKEKAMPEHKSEYNTVQYRKLTKSLNMLKFLLEKIK